MCSRTINSGISGVYSLGDGERIGEECVEIRLVYLLWETSLRHVGFLVACLPESFCLLDDCLSNRLLPVPGS